MLSFPLKTVISDQEGDRREGVVVKTGTSLKIGDRFKDKQTGKIYVLKMVIDRYTVLLEGENGMGRKITDEENLRRMCDSLQDKQS
jgi:hypothetical protein